MRKPTLISLIVFYIVPFFFVQNTFTQNIAGTWKAFENITINGNNTIHELEIKLSDDNGQITGTVQDKILGTNNFVVYELKGYLEDNFYWLSYAKILSSSTDISNLEQLVLKLKMESNNKMTGFVTTNNNKHNLYFNQGNPIVLNKGEEYPKPKSHPTLTRTEERNAMAKKSERTQPSPPIKIEQSKITPKHLVAESQLTKTIDTLTSTSKDYLDDTNSISFDFDLDDTLMYEDEFGEYDSTLDTTDFFIIDTSSFSLPDIPKFEFTKKQKEELIQETQEKFNKRKNYLDYEFDSEEDSFLMVITPIKPRMNYDTISIFIDKKLVKFYESINREKKLTYPIKIPNAGKVVEVVFVSEALVNKENRNTQIAIIGKNIEYQVVLTPYQEVNNQVNIKYSPMITE